MRERPNILLFITDQQRGDHLGCAGAAGLRTPAIDSLAARGVMFDRFYVTSPVCMPNRASLMTCRPPSLNGVRTSGLPLPLDSVTFVDLVRAAGWRTALIGKGHFQPFTGRLRGAPADPHGRRPDAGLANASRRPIDGDSYEQENPARWRDDPDWDVTTPYYGFEDVEICTGHADRVGGAYSRWLARHHPDPDSLRGQQNALPDDLHHLPQAWRTAIPEELYPTSFVKERTLAWLDAHGRDGPFFLQCSFPDPHHPFTPPGRYWDMYDPAKVPLPASFNAPHDNPPPHLAALWAARDEGRRNDSSPSAFAATEDEVRSAIALSWGMISMIDEAIGAVLQKLGELGLAENTVIVFTSDHGDLLGDHQLILKGPFTYDGVARVPFIWAEPGASPQRASPQRSGRLGSTMDIGATILDRLGLAPANGMLGRSLLPAMAGEGVRDQILIEYESLSLVPGTSVPARIRSLVNDDWRLSVYDGVEWGELYDLKDDPLELRNLWDSDAHRHIRSELTETLLREMIAAGETSPIPKYIA